MNITELIERSYATAFSRGWHREVAEGQTGLGDTTIYPTTINDPDGAARDVSIDYVGTKLMLVVSEIAEALEELRNNNSPVHIYWATPGHPLAGMTTGDGVPSEKLIEMGRKPEGFPIEIADAVIRIADLCRLLGIDLEGALELKMAYNAKRSYRHGGKAV